MKKLAFAEDDYETKFDLALNAMSDDVAQKFIDEVEKERASGELRPLFDKNLKE